MRLFCMFIGLVFASTLTVSAQDVNITPNSPSRSFTINGVTTTISRVQDQSNQLTGEFTKTSRACPPFCITPMVIAPGVETIGEIEVMDFLETRVADGTGLLIDSRVPEWFAKGSIPGAVNVPFTTLDSANPYRDEILKALGGAKDGTNWDYTEAMTLTLFCNGPWCEQTPRAIQSLIAAGYPPEKLKFYRGGIQLWVLLGLTTNQ